MAMTVLTHRARRLARRLHGREPQGDQHGDDGDDDEQLDDGEGRTRTITTWIHRRRSLDSGV
jgi:hypothetical protein